MPTETPHLGTDETEKRDIGGRDGGIQWSPVQSFARPRQNLSAPAFKLPAEVILEIFLIVRDSSDNKLKEWLQVTNVCNFWRQVALEAHTLWTCLCDTPPGFIPLMLERSKQAPLHISYTQLPPTALLGDILQEIERIQTIVFRLFKPSDRLSTIDEVLRNMGRDWEPSILESITMREVQFRPSPIPAIDVFRPTHRLRRLAILGGQYRWSMLPLPGLTELNLLGESSDAIPGDLFLETLRQMPNLEFLGLAWGELQLSRYPPTPLPQPVLLPFLRKLHVEAGHHEEIESFLSLLVHPQLQQLFADCYTPPEPADSEDESNFDFDAMETFTQAVVSATARGNFSGIQLVTADTDFITLSANPWPPTTFDEPYLQMVVPPNHDPDLIYDGGLILSPLTDILSSVHQLDRPDIFRLRHICIHGSNYEGMSLHEFDRVFTQLPHLESIEACNWVIFAVLDFLKEPSGRRSRLLYGGVSFTNLRTIIWRGEQLDLIPRSTSPFPPSTFEELHTALVLGRTKNVFIRRLEFVACDRLGDAQIRQLRDLGLEVVIRELNPAERLP